MKNINKFTKKPPKIGLISLGCPKALVDSEKILTSLTHNGYLINKDHRNADLVIVNTCGFIDSAKEESINTISSSLNDNGEVIITGCLGKDKTTIFVDKQITNDDANNIMRRSAMMLMTVKFHRRLDGTNVKSEFCKQLN